MATFHSKKIASVLIGTASFLAISSAVFAQTNTPNIDQRQINQERRIEQGEQSGSLTQREAQRLERGQDHVEHVEDRAKADGVVTKRERARMQHAENVQSRRIYREKHDRQHDFNHDGKMDQPRRGRHHNRD